MAEVAGGSARQHLEGRAVPGARPQRQQAARGGRAHLGRAVVEPRRQGLAEAARQARRSPPAAAALRARGRAARAWSRRRSRPRPPASARPGRGRRPRRRSAPGPRPPASRPSGSVSRAARWGTASGARRSPRACTAAICTQRSAARNGSRCGIDRASPRWPMARIASCWTLGSAWPRMACSGSSARGSRSRSRMRTACNATSGSESRKQPDDHRQAAAPAQPQDLGAGVAQRGVGRIAQVFGQPGVREHGGADAQRLLADARAGVAHQALESLDAAVERHRGEPLEDLDAFVPTGGLIADRFHGCGKYSRDRGSGAGLESVAVGDRGGRLPRRILVALDAPGQGVGHRQDVVDVGGAGGVDPVAAVQARSRRAP